MMAELPRIETVEADGLSLNIVWTDGNSDTADLSAVVDRFPPFASLKDEAIFRDVSVVAHGSGVEWANGLDYSAHRLKQIADVQREASREMSASDFIDWQTSAKLTVPLAAGILGMGTRQVIKYRNGDAAIPRVVQLAVRQFQREPGLLNALLPKVV